MFGKRVATAVFLLPPLIGAVLYGKGWPFAVLVGAVAVLCAREYFRMFFPSARDRWTGTGLTGLIYLSAVLLPPAAAWAAALLGVALAAFHFLPGDGPPAEKARGASLAALGAVYIGGFLAAYPRTIVLPRGEHWILLGLLSVFAGDTFAYIVGKTLGRRPLSPSVSPNKTVEGSLGGLAASIGLGTGYGSLYLPGVPVWIVFVASALLGVAGQAGDLFESLLKRAAGVKDSGTLLPGHGGMFDRADALISAGPVLHLIVLLVPLPGGNG